VREGEDLVRVTTGATLSRGLGRSYGDSSLPAATTVSGLPESNTAQAAAVASTLLGDRILAFDESSGVLHAESGLSLIEMNRLLLHRGWFTPVTPGTQFVTLGGMIASDIHGKNHHVAGTIGQHVLSLVMNVPGHGVVRCDRDTHPDLFRATLGGMGLTGHILEVELTMERVPSPWIMQESFRVKNIDAYVDALKDSAEKWPMTVGWIDCLSGSADTLGRGVLMCGRWATKEEAPEKAPKPKPRITMPAIFPSWTINNLTVRAFNWLYYHKHPNKVVRGVVHPETFFYPLDAIGHWNRIYGKAGFTQYQCVLPDEAGRAAVRAFLELCTQHGGASFLCVIKDCGPEAEGVLSFPMRGLSVAIDFPIRANTPSMVAALNEFVIAKGGRIYLTKDTFTSAEQFAAMEPRLAEFDAIRDQWDPRRQLRSAQSVRMLGDVPFGQTPTQTQTQTQTTLDSPTQMPTKEITT
jgi:decaprenylphospho-beta-D-ribofuranose 2-oxidase